MDNFDFFDPNFPKNGFWGRKVKNLSPNSEWAPPRYLVNHFSIKTDNFEFFGRNLRKLPNYVQYFGSNNIEGVAESWVEAEMSWVEVDRAGWRWVHGLVIPDYVQKMKNMVLIIKLSCAEITHKNSTWRIFIYNLSHHVITENIQKPYLPRQICRDISR